MAKVIDGGLGSRTTRKEGHKWSEVISALWSASLCGGDFLEDVGETGKTLRLAPGGRVPSTDTVGRAIKELATDSIEYTTTDFIHGRCAKYLCYAFYLIAS